MMCHHVTPHARAGLFSPANLLQGRVDVWCRCVTAGLYLSDAIRTNSTVHLVLQSDDLASCRLVSVDGATVEGLAPAERTVALLLQRAMQHASLDELPTLAREAPGRRRKEKASSVDDDDNAANNEGKSMRNAERRRRGWLAGQPGSRGPVPGIAVSDHHSLERALAWAMRGCGAVTLLDMDGDEAETVLGRVSFFSFPYGQLYDVVFCVYSRVVTGEERKALRDAVLALVRSRGWAGEVRRAVERLDVQADRGARGGDERNHRSAAILRRVISLSLSV